MDRIYTTIKEISKETRNAKHPKSMDAFYYMREQYEAIAKASGNPNITINTKPLKNKKYILPNLIVKIKGKKSFNRSIIIGSHFDSRVYNNINTMAPGANDSGSSCAVNLECFRTLVNQTNNNYTYEFHLYTGEEWGLKGSKAISSKYLKNKTNTVSYLNFDMVGWPKFADNKNIGLTSDYRLINTKLNKLVKILIENY